MGKILSQFIERSDFGWYHPNVIWLASVIVSDFGAILDENGWMIYGAPKSLLSNSKEDVKQAFEVLLKFLNNKNEWNKFRDKYPKNADSIISNSYYYAIAHGSQCVDRFIDDEKAKICVDVARSFKDGEYDNLSEILKDKDQMKTFFHTQEVIEENKKDWKSYLDSQEFFIKDDIFD